MYYVGCILHLALLRRFLILNNFIALHNQNRCYKHLCMFRIYLCLQYKNEVIKSEQAIGSAIELFRLARAIKKSAKLPAS